MHFGSNLARFIAIALLVVSCFGCFFPAGRVYAAISPPEVAAESYLVADVVTGRILASKDPNAAHIPASLTKIMTMHILFDEIASGAISLSDDVPISQRAWATGGSKMFILVGTTVKLEDLVKGITVMSGNDACVAVAEYVAGNESAFVDRMNAKARDLGLSATHFVDPHGLSDDNKVSAEDLMTLVRSYITVHPEALPYHAMKEFAYSAPGESAKAPQFNRNRLLWDYQGTYGLKTGFTTLAGFNMVALVERSNLHAIAIILGSAKGRSIDAGERERTEIAVSLLDWTFANYAYVQTSPKNTILGTARVWKGKGGKVDAIAPKDLGATVAKGEESSLQMQVILQEDLVAPVKKGAKVGEVVFTLGGEEVGRDIVVASHDVAKGNIFRIIWDSFVKLFSRSPKN